MLKMSLPGSFEGAWQRYCKDSDISVEVSTGVIRDNKVDLLSLTGLQVKPRPSTPNPTSQTLSPKP